VRELIDDIAILASARKIKVTRLARSAAKQAFGGARGLTKHEIATAIARLFPELAPRLPPLRKPWMPEDYRMAIFDSVALALSFFHFENKKSIAARRPPQTSPSALTAGL
jgi:hypothetical protein